MAINDLITKIDTKYGVILDADFTFLHKNWDEILISEISEEYPIIGTQSSEFSRKPLDFPYVYGILFDTEIFKKLNVDFKPVLIDATSPIIKDTGDKLRELANGKINEKKAGPNICRHIPDGSLLPCCICSEI